MTGDALTGARRGDRGSDRNEARANAPSGPPCLRGIPRVEMRFNTGKQPDERVKNRYLAGLDRLDMARHAFGKPPVDGQSVARSVRPEQIDPGAAPAGAHGARGAVSIVEPMGAKTIPWTMSANQAGSIRVDGDNLVKVADAIAFSCDVARGPLFNAASGTRPRKNISPARGRRRRQWAFRSGARLGRRSMAPDEGLRQLEGSRPRPLPQVG